MIKKVRKMIAFALVLAMAFSMTAFAAEDTVDSDVQIELKGIESYSDEPVAIAAAPPVTRVEFLEPQFDEYNNIIIPVYIEGYGHNEIAKWDDNNAIYVRQQLLSGSDRVVYAFIQYWNCGPMVPGMHTFTFSTISMNKPWNTVSASAQYLVSE